MGVNYLMPSRFAVSVLSLLAEGNPVRRQRAIKSDQTRLDRINKINRMHGFHTYPVHPVNPAITVSHVSQEKRRSSSAVTLAFSRVYHSAYIQMEGYALNPQSSFPSVAPVPDNGQPLRLRPCLCPMPKTSLAFRGDLQSGPQPGPVARVSSPAQTPTQASPHHALGREFHGAGGVRSLTCRIRNDTVDL